ncbi:hypothetical protein EVJ58_g4570 [Rhodofomes roseus]|uniref:Uncharacterized protein n=1 Tax=Rhodofomes roseus TaxID=34475 RepID=A0A4Y9YIC2_9APHY|nr:hypothetical protein EVJ58_g4570 [Rhodofomes roseus]
MRRSSAYLWKGSLKNVQGLPPCPKGWIEPSWVSLVFSPYCTECGVGKATTVIWEFLARFCPLAWGCSRVVAKNRVYTILGFDYVPADILIESTVTGFSVPCYLQSQVSDAIAAYEKLSSPRRSDERRELSNKHMRQAKLSREFATLCYKWQANDNRIRTQEFEAVIDERLDDVISRLRALEWGPELDFIQSRDYVPLSEHKLVRVAKKLTDRVWQNMQSEILQCMNGIRKEREEHEYNLVMAGRWSVLQNAGRELLDRYIGEHPELITYGLDVADLALFQEFRKIMCVPADESVNRADFLALESQMDTMVERWRTHICKQLRGSFVTCNIETPSWKNPLDLATTVFELPIRGLASFPSVVANVAVRFPMPRSRRSAYEKFVYGQTRADSTITGLKIKPMKPNGVMRAVIQLCGKDPDWATAEDMDALDKRLINEDVDEIVTWRGAIMAATTGWSQRWRLANAEETAKVKEIEARLLAVNVKVWTCTRCEGPQMPASRDAVRDHLCDVHGIGLTDIEDGDIDMNQTLAHTELTWHHIKLYHLREDLP